MPMLDAADIVGHVMGDADAGKRYADQRLAARREHVVA
jgi:hypothetical protein